MQALRILYRKSSRLIFPFLLNAARIISAAFPVSLLLVTTLAEMEELQEFLQPLCDRSPRFRLADVDFNVVIRALARCKDIGLDKYDPTTDILLRHLLYISEPDKLRFAEIFGKVPLPNKKVSVAFIGSSSTKGAVWRKPSVEITCETVAELFRKIDGHPMLKLQGWPVARRVGQNVGMYHKNTGLKVTLEFMDSMSEAPKAITSE